MSELSFTEFEAFSANEFQKLSQSQSDSNVSEYEPGEESEEESSSFSESQVGCGYLNWSMGLGSKDFIVVSGNMIRLSRIKGRH